MKKLVTGTYIGYFINRVLGAILGITISGILVFSFLTVVRHMSTYQIIIPVNNLIKDSTITKFLYNNNFVYNLIAKIIDLQPIIDKIMDTMATVGIS